MVAQPTTNDQEPTTGDVAVLVPAAGRGIRLGGQRKQFRRLGEASLLVQTLRAFERHADVDSLVVAAPAGEASELEEELHAAGLGKLEAVVEGGATRQASVRAALQAAPLAAGLVLVHDAVRPFVTVEAVTAVIEAAREHGAAALAIPVADTLRRAADGQFGETISRQGLYRMQTPQAFRRAWLEEAHAHAAAAEDAQPATDDVELVKRLGRSVRLVEGSPYNFKITTPDDWMLARHLWPHWAEKVSG